MYIVHVHPPLAGLLSACMAGATNWALLTDPEHVCAVHCICTVLALVCIFIFIPRAFFSVCSREPRAMAVRLYEERLTTDWLAYNS